MTFHKLSLGLSLARGIALLALCGGVNTYAVDPGQIVLEAHGAHAEAGNDDQTWNQQDFYLKVQFPGDPSIESGWDMGFDDVSWRPFVATQTVPKTRRFHNVTVQLWDDDDGVAGNTSNKDDKFDINPGLPDQLDIQFDACTMRWYAPGLTEEQGPGIAYPPFGKGPPTDHGRIDLEITTGDRLPFTPDKLTLVGLGPVQVVFEPLAVVSGKATAIRVKIANTYNATVNAPVTVAVRDGLINTSETRTLTLAQGVSTHYFFDGAADHAAPFYPTKPSGQPKADLIYSALIEFQSQAPPGTPIELIDCYLMENSIIDKKTPIVITSGPQTVFAPFDFLDTPFAPPFWQVQTMATNDERFRKAIWPIDHTSEFTLPLPLTPPADVSPIGLFIEPVVTIQIQSIAASVAGIDRLVLVPHKGWFAQNDYRSVFWNGNSIGQSNGEFGSHAVIAEYGHYGVSTHELGHTYKLSVHSCTSDIQDAFGVGCRDEYKFDPSDGAPFIGYGLDVEGSVFPSGAGCEAPIAGSREVCLRNLMDRTGKDGYENWIDTFTYNYMLKTLSRPEDPELINLSGVVRSLNGLIPPGPPIFEGKLSFSYHFDGVPDVADPLLPGMPAASTGGGKFAFKLISNDGRSRTYRFQPSFHIEGADDAPDGAGFSFNVAWDPSLQSIELYAPSNALVGDCEDQASCASQDLLIASRTRSAASPTVTVLRAGRDVAPSLVGAEPTPALIGPGHQAVLAWNGSDSDSPELRSVVLLNRLDAAGGPPQWIPLRAELSGNQLVLPHSQLSPAPGDYKARVVVSDGFNSTTITSDTILRVCNFTNQGAEICNGIDDDCDGTIDNALPPPGSIGVSVSKTAVSWAGVAAAETYDVVRGDVATLRTTDGDFTSATQQCLANDVADSTTSFTANPSVGNAWWVLVRGSNCLARGSYDGVGAGQVGQRDAEIAASPAACP